MIRNLTDPAGKSMIVTDVGVGGGIVLARGFPETTPEMCKAYFEGIPDISCREDDVVLLNWPKTGSHWMHEILAMLVNKSAERPTTIKGSTMLEFVSAESVGKVASPRILNTHVPYRYLPRDMKEKQIKAVFIMRNPKDTMVSLYNHITGFHEYQYDGEWKDWLQLYMQGEMLYGPYSTYLKEFEKAINEGPGFPLYVLHYEDLKQNGTEEIRKLADFLELGIDDELCAEIDKQCSFDVMAKDKPFSEEIKTKFMYKGFNYYRKGQIGDWKNWFTVAQSEHFDAYWKREMAGSKLKFTYSPNSSPE